MRAVKTTSWAPQDTSSHGVLARLPQKASGRVIHGSEKTADPSIVNVRKEVPSARLLER